MWCVCRGTVRGYGKCVCGNQQKPNVNHFFIADAALSPNIQHIISEDTNNDMHELRGIGPGSVIGYVLYASENGVCHWDEDNEQLFLAAAQSWRTTDSKEQERFSKSMPIA